MAPQIDAHFMIHAGSEDYSCFPSLQRHPSGDLYVTFRNAPELGDGTYTHIDTRSTGILKRSADEGRTWEQVGDPIPGHLPQSGVQDPSLTILADGSFLVTYFHWRHQPDHPKARSGAIFEGTWVRISRDQGQTWSDPVYVPVDESRPLAISEPAIQQADGALLLVGYAGMGCGGHASFISRSEDKGLSWSQPTIIAHDLSGMVDYQEPALIDLGGGHLLCLMRAVDRHLTIDDADEQKRQRGLTAWMYQTHSWDNGLTWDLPTRTEIYGHPPNLIQLQDGRILCSYGYRRDPFGVRACFSHDGGQTWDMENEIVLRADGGGFDLGYPSSIQLPDGRILTSYYFHTSENRLRRIEATLWRP
ncbi:MAG: exo-alpha-sialidase [Caldilineaceae bacterium]|nr:exo-alpha-sialidase [Caldilineaceae bacterium]